MEAYPIGSEKVDKQLRQKPNQTDKEANYFSDTSGVHDKHIVITD